jgi:hypothetical protein
VAPLEIDVTAPVRRWTGAADGSAAGSWHFLALPGEESDDVRARAPESAFGSVKVTATIGDTTWSTSLFPDAASGCYLLPVKADVRRRQGIEDGDHATVHLVVHV